MTARRMRGEGSIYERSPGRWCGQVDLGWVGGKRKRRTVYGPSQEAVVKSIQQIRRQVEDGIRATSSPTVEWWLRHWLEDIAARKVKPRTLTTYRSYVEVHLIPAVGKKKLDRLEPQHVRDLHRAMAAKSSTTVLHAHRVLSTALEAARKSGKVTRNVATLVEAPRKATSDRDALSTDEAKAVIAAAGEGPLAARWWAAFMTGARQGELLGLRWSHVDLEQGYLDIAWSLQRVPYGHGCGAAPDDRGKPWPCGRRAASCPDRQVTVPAGMEYHHLEGNLCLLRPKTKGSRRIVPLVPAMVAALRLHQQTDAGPNPHGLVWHRPDGRPWNAKLDLAAWTALLKAAKVEHCTLHEARNTAASLLLELGVDAHVVASILGHSNIVTTRGYQRVSLELARKAVSGLGETLGISAPAPGVLTGTAALR